MRLVRKLQLAYLSLVLIPIFIVGSLVFATYYMGTGKLGPRDILDAPGWLKPELISIFEEDWARYDEVRGQSVVFIMAADGFLVFPTSDKTGPVPRSYPHGNNLFTPDVSTPLSAPESGNELSAISYLPDIFKRYGTEWTVNINITPVKWKDQAYMVGWGEPEVGLAGFLSRKGWMMPLFIITGILLIPALIDRKLRRSITQLQSAVQALSDGRLDQPISVIKKDDLYDLAVSLETTRKELKESRDRKARFLMAVSHDLRTPLTSIKGYIEALGDGMAETPEDFARYLSVLEEKAGLLENRIGELIDFARSETGGWKRPSGAVLVKELMSRLDAAFRKDAGFSERIYESETTLPDNLIIDGDADALYRAWENLYSNAVRHTEKGESLGFQVRFTPTETGISEGTLSGEVINHGTDIDSEFIPRLFEPFTRADRGRNSEGLGLGLASVKAVAEAHGGSVEYRPIPGGGSAFCIRIPCHLS